MPPLEAETSRGDFFRVKHTKQKWESLEKDSFAVKPL
jgi:hypothetical protein